jgi:hypothetical protein
VLSTSVDHLIGTFEEDDEDPDQVMAPAA